MDNKYGIIVALGVCVSALSPGLAADHHRVLVLDALKEFGSPRARLLVVEVESGKIIAQADIGQNPEVGVSPTGDVLAVLTDNLVGGLAQPHARLEIYRTSDLMRLQSGLLPFVGRGGFQDYAREPTIYFSPDGQEVLVQRLETYLNKEKPLRWPVHNTLWRILRRELDDNQTFKSAGGDIRIPRAMYPTVLRASQWPQIDIWSVPLGALETVNVNGGVILSRLALDYEEDPVLRNLDPAYLERPDINELSMRLGANGRVVGDGRRYAYYVPHPTRNRNAQPGFLKKIDLDAGPPKVIMQGEQRQPGLWAAVSAVSQPGQAVVVAVEQVQNGKPSRDPSGRVRIYSTMTLKPQNDVVLSVLRCDSLTPSGDGKYMYALDRGEAQAVVIDAASGTKSRRDSASRRPPRLSVIDIATGRELKVLDSVGQVPAVVMALPDAG